MKPIIIDNFLEEKDFKAYQALICTTTFDSTFSWGYGQYHDPQTNVHEALITNYFFTHVFYANGLQNSPHLPVMQHFVEKIKTMEGSEEDKKMYNASKEQLDYWPMNGGIIKSVLRMRANLFVNTSTVYEYPMHTDYPFSHSAAILSLNTCDGYTGIEDEDGQTIKVDSVANRVVLFDAGKNHCSTTTSDANARFNIIVNFI
jgi:hypothetical protein